MACLTFYKIKNMKKFFEVINGCAAPVVLHMQEGCTEDLRFNRTVQHLITWLAPAGSISGLKLQSNDEQDTVSLIRFMMER